MHGETNIKLISVKLVSVMYVFDVLVQRETTKLAASV
jgi:hypothetical protein